MGIGNHRAKHQYGLHDLGILDGPRLRGADTIVKTVADLFRVRHALFLAFDDAAGCARIRVTSRIVKQAVEVPIAESISALIRAENAPLAIESLPREAPTAPELLYLDAVAFMGTPVHGPDKEAIGVLAAVHNGARKWNRAEIKKLGDLAHLISQEIMLRASFETLRIMSAERQLLSS